MKTQKIGLEVREKKISIEVRRCGALGKFIGLMFSRRQNASALLFDFNKPTRTSIHSFFVFFPFYAVWLDDKNKIIEIRRIPSWKFSVKPKKDFTKLVEIPVNKKYSEIIRSLVGE